MTANLPVCLLAHTSPIGADVIVETNLKYLQENIQTKSIVSLINDGHHHPLLGAITPYEEGKVSPTDGTMMQYSSTTQHKSMTLSSDHILLMPPELESSLLVINVLAVETKGNFKKSFFAFTFTLTISCNVKGHRTSTT
jgi:hypothetical protein